MVGGLLRDLWAWVILDPERAWVMFVAGVLAQFLLTETFKTILPGRRKE